MAHNETLMLPCISSQAANQVLCDIGLLPNGKDQGNNDSSTGELVVSTYDRAKIMAREQLLFLKSANPELLTRVARAVHLNYPHSDSWRRTFGIGSMATIKAFSYQLKEPFALYLQNMRAQDLDTFELFLTCATPLTPNEDMFDEVEHGPELPQFQEHLRRVIQIMSLTAVSTDFADKLRIGAGCTYLAIAHTLPIPADKNDHPRPELVLAEMVRTAHIIDPASITITQST